jgi:uncharacterized protein (DUF2384 family)
MSDAGLAGKGRVSVRVEEYLKVMQDRLTASAMDRMEMDIMKAESLSWCRYNYMSDAEWQRFLARCREVASDDSPQLANSSIAWLEW